MRKLRIFFSSLKVAILLIAVLIFLSIIGTLIPQNRDAHEYCVLYPTVGDWICLLGFDDLYGSFPFLIVSAMLTLSTIVCTITRFRFFRRRCFYRLKHTSVVEVESFTVKRALEMPPDTEGFECKTDDSGNELHLRVTGRLNLVGGLLIHMGFLSMVAGGVIGWIYRVETTVSGMAGDRIPVPCLSAIRAAERSDALRRKARAIIHRRGSEDPALTVLKRKIDELEETYRNGLKNPAFKIFFKDLWMDYHPPESDDLSPSLKGWNSLIEIIDNGAAVASATVMVNSPFSYKGYNLFQASWRKKYQTVHLKLSGNESEKSVAQNVSLKLGQPCKLSDLPYSLILSEFYPDFRIISDDRFVSVSDSLNNPAALVLILDESGNSVAKTWAFSGEMVALSRHVSDSPFMLSFVSADPIFESILQVTYDPGIPMIWIGCMLMCTGMLFSFYIPYREDWVLKKPCGGSLIAVNGNRPLKLNVWLEELADNPVSIVRATSECNSGNGKGT